MGKKSKQKTGVNRRGQKNAEEKGLKQFVLSIFEKTPTKPLSPKQVIKASGVRDKASKLLVENSLFRLEEEEKIVQLKGHRFKLNREPETLIGTVDYVNPNFAYIETPEGEDDIWVHTRNMLNALDGDTVKVNITTSGRKDRRPEGEVIEVIKRDRTQFVGRVQINPNYIFVIPDFKKMHVDIFVYPENAKGIKPDDKVIVEVSQWHGVKGNKNPIGKIIQVLGKAGENEAEIHSIIAEFGLPYKFPERVLESAENISTEISQKEIKSRKDFRRITTFTIDPEDAKDFDDALSYQKLENGLHEVGIHIADVSHYVKENSILDREAFDRATSVYLVDRTIPMLPEKLSNELCSLRPNEDKLTFSAVFQLDDEGKIKKEWFGRTIIHSVRRFSYEEAQERIETGEGDFIAEIRILDGLAKKLKAMRFKNGAIAFETVEVKFKLDEKGTPLGIIPKVRKDAHKMIEEFMLLANKRVAEFVYNKESRKEKNTFVYRTHDNPDPEKLNNFSVFAKRFGHNLNVEIDELPNSLNALMANIEGKPEQNVLESIAIRAMAKAKYTTAPKGHFGLAFRHYTHFTSPIRRFPDVMVHRLLDHYLDGGKPPDKDEFEQRCLHSSEREKRAADTERASIKYKQVEYMKLAEVKDYEGIVSGVTEWGVFVEIIETKCEGMARLSEMGDDHYEFDEDNYRVVGRRNKRMITLGDKVMVRVIDTDIDRRTIDLEII
ncbi:MAG: ribonuclease R [Bacteroidetes bacterium]|nr:ribonuclease R [Bacteroidota bacterium]MDA1118976.1 ribonuclease R [Bacteroidota bacterium]